MEKEIGCVLTYKDVGSTRGCGQQIGSDGSGNYCVIFKGDPIKSKKAAISYINDLHSNDFSRFKNINIIPMIKGYHGMPIKVIDIDNDISKD